MLLENVSLSVCLVWTVLIGLLGDPAQVFAFSQYFLRRNVGTPCFPFRNKNGPFPPSTGDEKKETAHCAKCDDVNNCMERRGPLWVFSQRESLFHWQHRLRLMSPLEKNPVVLLCDDLLLESRQLPRIFRHLTA